MAATRRIRPPRPALGVRDVARRLLPFVRPHRSAIGLLLLLTLVGAGLAQVNALVLRHTVDSIAGLVQAGRNASQSTQLLLLITAVLAGKELLNIAVRYGQSMIGETLRVALSSRLSQTAIERILTYRHGWFGLPENATGKLQVRIDRGAESLTRFVQNIFIDLLPLLANAALALVLMFQANWIVGTVAALIAPLYFLLSWLQARLLRGLRQGLRALREARTQGLFTLIESIVVIKSFVREDTERLRQAGVQQALIDAQLQQRRTNYSFDAAKTFAEQVGVTVIIILTAALVLDGRMTLGAIMFHVLLFNNVSAPMRQLHRIYDEINEALTYAEGYFEVLEADDALEPSGSHRPHGLRGEFTLQHVDFSYPDGTLALQDIDLTIPAGRTTALVGLSGAGKTTLVNLLTRLYEPTAGRILLDGVPLDGYDTRALRREIGLVLQKNHIFKGSVADNIRYGDLEATDAQVEAAARRADLHEQIAHLPAGYATDATQLSGGQQQRIAIARLFLKDPPVLILDEPTASLDAIATEQIQRSLDAIRDGRTVITVSHSLAQILDAEHLIVMQKGRVVQQGTHEALIGVPGPYRDIVHASARSLNLQRLEGLHPDLAVPDGDAG